MSHLNKNVNYSILDIDQEIENEEKNMKLEKLKNDLQNLYDIHSDLNNIVVSENENFEQIDNTLDSTMNNVHLGEDNLEQAMTYHNSSLKWKAMFVGGTIGAVALGPLAGGVLLGVKTSGILLLSGAGLFIGGGAGNSIVKK